MTSWIFLALFNTAFFAFLKLGVNELKKKQIAEISNLQLSLYLILLLAYFFEKFFYNKVNYSLLFLFSSSIVNIFFFFKTYKYFSRLRRNIFNVFSLVFISFLAIIFAYIIEEIKPFFYSETFSYPELYLSQYRLYIIVIFLSLLPSFFEEHFYRELIYNKLRKFYSVFFTITLSSILFYLMHLVFNPHIQSFFYLIPLGLILGYIRSKSRTVLPCIIFHFFYNLTVITLDVYI